MSQRVPGIPRVPRDPPLRLKGPGNLRVPRLAEGPWNSQVAKHPNAPRTHPLLHEAKYIPFNRQPPRALFGLRQLPRALYALTGKSLPLTMTYTFSSIAK